MFKWYWTIAILFIPLIHRNIPEDSRIYKDIYFMIVGVSSLFLFKNKFSSISLVGLIFAIYSIAMPYTTIGGNAFFQTMNILIGLGLISQFACNWDESLEQWIMNAFSLAAITQCVWVFSQKLGHEPMLDVFGVQGLSGLGLIEGSLANRMVSAAYLGPLVPFLYRKWWCLFIPMVFLALYYLGSSMGMLSACIGLGYMISKNWKLSHIIASALLGAGGLCIGIRQFPVFFDPSGRYLAWKQIIQLVGFQWTGFGTAVFHDKLWPNITAISGLKHPHNEFILAYLNWGVIGLVFCLVGIIYLLRVHKMTPIFAASLLGILAASMGSFPLHISSSSLIFIIALGSLTHYSKVTKEAI